MLSDGMGGGFDFLLPMPPGAGSGGAAGAGAVGASGAQQPQQPLQQSPQQTQQHPQQVTLDPGLPARLAAAARQAAAFKAARMSASGLGYPTLDGERVVWGTLEARAASDGGAPPASLAAAAAAAVAAAAAAGGGGGAATAGRALGAQALSVGANSQLPLLAGGAGLSGTAAAAGVGGAASGLTRMQRLARWNSAGGTGQPLAAFAAAAAASCVVQEDEGYRSVDPWVRLRMPPIPGTPTHPGAGVTGRLAMAPATAVAAPAGVQPHTVHTALDPVRVPGVLGQQAAAGVTGGTGVAATASRPLSRRLEDEWDSPTAQPALNPGAGVGSAPGIGAYLGNAAPGAEVYCRQGGGGTVSATAGGALPLSPLLMPGGFLHHQPPAVGPQGPRLAYSSSLGASSGTGAATALGAAGLGAVGERLAPFGSAVMEGVIPPDWQPPAAASASSLVLRGPLGSVGGAGGKGGPGQRGSGALSPDEVRATVEAVLRRLVDDVQLWHLMQDLDDDV